MTSFHNFIGQLSLTAKFEQNGLPSASTSTNSIMAEAAQVSPPLLTSQQVEELVHDTIEPKLKYETSLNIQLPFLMKKKFF